MTPTTRHTYETYASSFDDIPQTFRDINLYDEDVPEYVIDAGMRLDNYTPETCQAELYSGDGYLDPYEVANFAGNGDYNNGLFVFEKVTGYQPNFYAGHFQRQSDAPPFETESDKSWRAQESIDITDSAFSDEAFNFLLESVDHYTSSECTSDGSGDGFVTYPEFARFVGNGNPWSAQAFFSIFFGYQLDFNTGDIIPIPENSTNLNSSDEIESTSSLSQQKINSTDKAYLNVVLSLQEKMTAINDFVFSDQFLTTASFLFDDLMQSTSLDHLTLPQIESIGHMLSETPIQGRFQNHATQCYQDLHLSDHFMKTWEEESKLCPQIVEQRFSPSLKNTSDKDYKTAIDECQLASNIATQMWILTSEWQNGLESCIQEKALQEDAIR